MVLKAEQKGFLRKAKTFKCKFTVYQHLAHFCAWEFLTADSELRALIDNLFRRASVQDRPTTQELKEQEVCFGLIHGLGAFITLLPRVLSLPPIQSTDLLSLCVVNGLRSTHFLEFRAPPSYLLFSSRRPSSLQHNASTK